jgi:hypothetical protein
MGSMMDDGTAGTGRLRTRKVSRPSRMIEHPVPHAYGTASPPDWRKLLIRPVRHQPGATAVSADVVIVRDVDHVADGTRPRLTYYGAPQVLVRRPVLESDVLKRQREPKHLFPVLRQRGDAMPVQFWTGRPSGWSDPSPCRR